MARLSGAISGTINGNLSTNKMNMNTNTINETISDGKRAYANWSTLDLYEYMGELHAHHAWLDEQADEATRTMDGDAEFQAQHTEAHD